VLYFVVITSTIGEIDFRKGEVNYGVRGWAEWPMFIISHKGGIAYLVRAR
jgi:hypothetical protein